MFYEKDSAFATKDIKQVALTNISRNPDIIGQLA